jgi:phosphoenolpyruvate carboxylase
MTLFTRYVPLAAILPPWISGRTAAFCAAYLNIVPKGTRLMLKIKNGYLELTEDEKLAKLTFNEADLYVGDDADDLIKDTLQTIRLMKTVQQTNGERACQRFIISNCQQASDILQLMDLFLWSGWTKDELTVDFMPLFETVNDLSHAAGIMENCYTRIRSIKSICSTATTVKPLCWVSRIVLRTVVT